MWFIGDHLVRSAYPYLQQLQQGHDAGQTNYLHSHYDTYIFYPNFNEGNVLTMVRNAFVEAMNRRLKFPSAVVILISDQIIMEDPLYLPSEIDRKIKWILREIDATVKIRKSLLPTKAYVFGEPRIMWVRGFQNTKANYIPDEILLKYNNMLRKICMAKAVYTIPVDTYNNASLRCFDYDGKMQIKDGFETLWHDIIRGLKKHDLADKEAEIAQVVKENVTDRQLDPRASNNNNTGFRSRNHDRRDSVRSRSTSRRPHQSEFYHKNIDYDRTTRNHNHDHGRAGHSRRR